MLSLIGRRLAALVPVMLVVSFVVFMLSALIPGDVASVVAGEGAPPERVAQVRAELGLDQPLLVQYWDWLRHAAVLDFGN